MSKYGLILVGICIADLISTIILVNFGCNETNLLLSQYFSINGIVGLAMAKVFMNSCSVLGLEVCYHKEPSVTAFGKEIRFYYVLASVCM